MRKIITFLLVCVIFTNNINFIYADTTPTGGTISENTTWTSGTLDSNVILEDGVTLTINGQINISGDVTIYANSSANINRDSSYKNVIFNILGKSSLTINNISINGGAVYGSDIGAASYSSTLQRETNNTGISANNSFFSVNGTLNLNNVIVNNCDSSSNGGAISVNSLGTLNVDSCSFINNTSRNYGGAIYGSNNKSLNPTINIKNSSFISNTAISTYALGGAICAYGRNDLIIDNCEFLNNESKYGGGLYTTMPTYITDSEFKLNNAKTEGGAIYSEECFLSINDDCLIEDNISTDIYSTAIYAKNGLDLENSEVHGTINARNKIVVKNCIRDAIADCYGYSVEDVQNLNRVIEVSTADEFYTKYNDSLPISTAINYFSNLGYCSNDPFTFKLTDDLDFSSITGDSVECYFYEFSGNIDGQGYTISNLNKPFTKHYIGIIFSDNNLSKYENYSLGYYEDIYPIYMKNVSFKNCSLNNYSALIAEKANYITFVDCKFENIDIVNSNGGSILTNEGYIIGENIDVSNCSINCDKNASMLISNAMRSELETCLFYNCNISGNIEAKSGNIGSVFATSNWFNYNSDLPANGLKSYIYKCNSDANLTINCDNTTTTNVGGFTGKQNLATKFIDSTFSGSITVNGPISKEVYVGGLNGSNDEGIFCFGGGVIYDNSKCTGSLPNNDTNLYVGTLVGYNYSFDTHFTGTNEDLHKQFGYIRGLKFVDCKGDFTIDNDVKWLTVDSSCDIHSLIVNGNVNYLFSMGLNNESITAENLSLTPAQVKQIKANSIGIGAGDVWWPVGYGPLTLLYAGIYTDNIDATTITQTWGSYSAGHICYLRGGHIVKGQDQVLHPVDEEIREFLVVEKDGFVFMGWFDNETLSGTEITTPIEGKKYYAKWYCEDHSDLINEYKEVEGTHKCPDCDFEFTVTIEGGDVCTHEWGEEIIDLDPTCTNEGRAHKQCIHCTNVLRYNLPAKGHSLKEPEIIGDYEYVYCEVCGELIKKYKHIDEPIPPTPPHYDIPKTGIE